MSRLDVESVEFNFRLVVIFLQNAPPPHTRTNPGPSTESQTISETPMDRDPLDRNPSGQRRAGGMHSTGTHSCLCKFI